jgi:cold shock CspA family protein
MLQGQVVRWFSDRRFGFIKSELEPADVFFHQKAVMGDWLPTQGAHVRFDIEIEERTGKKRASRVCKVDRDIPLPHTLFKPVA